MQNAEAGSPGQGSPDRGLWGYQLASVKKTLALFQPVPTVSFRFGKLWTESLCLGASPSRSWLFAVWLHGRDARATTGWLAGGKGAGNLHMRRQKSRVEVRRSDHGRDARGTAGPICVARLSWPWVHGRDARATAGALRGPQKKSVYF